jgi:hypothetical protein
MFTVKKNRLDKERNNERGIVYRGYVAIEYTRDGKMIIWNGSKPYTT